jgi:hypothetical protein
MRFSTMSVLGCGLAPSACSLYFEQDPGDGRGQPAPESCVLAGASGRPGHHFDPPELQQAIWPATQAACGLAGCHHPTAASSFRVWPDDGDPCSVIRSFNQLHVALHPSPRPGSTYMLLAWRHEAYDSARC